MPVSPGLQQMAAVGDNVKWVGGMGKKMRISVKIDGEHMVAIRSPRLFAFAF